jgi:hypothetical protein
MRYDGKLIHCPEDIPEDAVLCAYSTSRNVECASEVATGDITVISRARMDGSSWYKELPREWWQELIDRKIDAEKRSAKQQADKRNKEQLSNSDPAFLLGRAFGLGLMDSGKHGSMSVVNGAAIEYGYNPVAIRIAPGEFIITENVSEKGYGLSGKTAKFLQALTTTEGVKVWVGGRVNWQTARNFKDNPYECASHYLTGGGVIMNTLSQLRLAQINWVNARKNKEMYELCMVEATLACRAAFKRFHDEIGAEGERVLAEIDTRCEVIERHLDTGDPIGRDEIKAINNTAFIAMKLQGKLVTAEDIIDNRRW